MQLPQLNTIRNRLFLSSVVITGIAVAIVYLYVVPQLESSLTGERLSGIEQRGQAQVHRIESALRGAPGQEPESPSLERALTRVAETTGTRVTLLSSPGEEGAESLQAPAGVIADSERQEALSAGSSEIAAEASRGGVATGIGVGETGRRAEVAIPIPAASGRTEWIAVFSEPLEEIEQNVTRIRRQILVAILIALGLSLITGFVASRYLGRRLHQLAEAARKLAGGNFATQVPVGPRDEVGEVARAFNEMQVRLADLDRARRQFIANASHELRTPIFSLGGFIELLDEEELDPETRSEFIASMREQTERLTKLTADLLDLSKLDSGAISLSPRPIDLGELADELSGELGPRADAHGSRLEVRTPDEPPVAIADADRTRQIIRILLDNAITHTPPGTKVTVTTRTEGARATLTVFDEGPGIPKHVRQRMFDRFYTAADSGGSGLGLPIARSLALRMNGQLTFGSGRGRSSFTLDLPRARPAPAAAPAPAPAAGSGV